MKTSTIMIFTIFLSLSAFGQKYAKILDQKMSAEDLDYMPIEELILLKNELIATKGSDIIRSKDDTKQPYAESPEPFLDTISQANLSLISKLEFNLSEKDSVCTKLELYKRLIKTIEHQQKIPFYIQTIFLGSCQNPEANVYLLPVSEKFNTIAISANPASGVGPEHHRILTFNLEGNQLDSKTMHGKAQFKENKIIHESYNSLIEYTYTIDEEGKFDKKTPTKKVD